MEERPCPICLEAFEENEALIPELECSCLLIVHEKCWEPWSGECLYCRQTEEPPNLEPPIQIRQINQTVYVVHTVNLCPTIIVILGIVCSFFFQLNN
jgi:hypothetical protein